MFNVVYAFLCIQIDFIPALSSGIGFDHLKYFPIFCFKQKLNMEHAYIFVRKKWPTVLRYFHLSELKFGKNYNKNAKSILAI